MGKNFFDDTNYFKNSIIDFSFLQFSLRFELFQRNYIDSRPSLTFLSSRVEFIREKVREEASWLSSRFDSMVLRWLAPMYTQVSREFPYCRRGMSSDRRRTNGDVCRQDPNGPLDDIATLYSVLFPSLLALTSAPVARRWHAGWQHKYNVTLPRLPMAAPRRHLSLLRGSLKGLGGPYSHRPYTNDDFYGPYEKWG